MKGKLLTVLFCIGLIPNLSYSEDGFVDLDNSNEVKSADNFEFVDDTKEDLTVRAPANESDDDFDGELDIEDDATEVSSEDGIGDDELDLDDASEPSGDLEAETSEVADEQPMSAAEESNISDAELDNELDDEGDEAEVISDSELDGESQDDEFGDIEDDTQESNTSLAEEDDNLQDLPDSVSEVEQPIVDETTFEEEVVVEEEPEMESSPQVTEYAEDAPNLDYERRLYDIFVEYHQQPTPDEEWSGLLSAQQGVETYDIQQGDTLWDISTQLFGDGNYWTKLWSNNYVIENPHLISQGMQVRFKMGSEENAPSMEVAAIGAEANSEQTSEEETGQAMGAEGANSAEKKNAEVSGGKIPPSELKFTPVLKNIPESMPPWRTVSKNGNYDQDGMELIVTKPIPMARFIEVNSLVSEYEPKSLGQIVELERGSRLASKGQFLYIKHEDEQNLVQGRTYSVVFNRGKLRSSNNEVDDLIGYNIQIQGIVKIVGTVDSTEGTLYRAKVMQSYTPIERYAQVVEKIKIKKIEYDSSGPRSKVIAQVIGGEYSDSRKLLGPGSIVFINQGSRAGVRPGQILMVRERRNLRQLDSILKEHLNLAGKIKIVNVEENVATAVVTGDSEEIQTGDYTGGGKIFAALTKEALSKSTAPFSDSLEDEVSDDDLIGDEDNLDDEGDDFTDDEFDD